MKPTNATLNAILAGREFYAVDLYQITLNNTAATVLRYCQGQQDIVFGGNTYSAGGSIGPYFDRKDNKAKVAWKTGSGHSSLVIDVAPGSATVVNSVPFLAAAIAGFFDGADFQLYRAFMTTYGVVQTGCAVLLFQGRIAEVDADRALLTFTVNDYRELFNMQLPRNLFAASCANAFGDASCTVNLTLFSSTSLILAGSTPTAILASSANLGQPDAYYDNGKITFTSGQMSGFTYGLSKHFATSPPQLNPIAPLPFTPSTGDTFIVYPGCDHSTGINGCTKYNNLANFRGFPYVPVPEAAL